MLLNTYNQRTLSHKKELPGPNVNSMKIEKP